MLCSGPPPPPCAPPVPRQVEERRTNMPLRQQKRHDLYALQDKTA